MAVKVILRFLFFVLFVYFFFFIMYLKSRRIRVWRVFHFSGNKFTVIIVFQYVFLFVEVIKSFLFPMCSDFEILKSQHEFLFLYRMCFENGYDNFYFVYAKCLQKCSIVNKPFSLFIRKQIDIREGMRL